ncbi:ISAs1 family transposase [Sabulilitoribacter arenilitoris]|uniref:ISAs1 family transposase n=1 Tax=Wocania arenilitoris TaxID=2044858 RepID=A0AAE3EM92_9FLAO|nr:ISAs1 family transposase [Wocania arenilitoris]MCF7567492.1 ISAs1 family transposase [Wocania arenilitoris]
MKTTNKLRTIFGQIPDFRRSHKQLYDLESILLIGIISVICGAELWNEMEDYACAKEEFLRTFLELPNGIPSHDTFNRVFSNINSNEFETCFIEWVSILAQLNPKEIIAIDGKTIRGAKSNGKKSPVHMVSAWANDNNVVLEQVKVSEKSNEITAIPKLLEVLSIEDTIVTIDAMGCQREIATKIIDKKADYILAVKENQAQLYQDLEDEFRFGKHILTHLSNELDHGRIETRICSIITDFKFTEDNNKWKNLTTLIKIESTREFKNSDKSIEKATRYYISSLYANPEDFQKAIRSHWGIENKLHWTLDVAFSEDASRKRVGNASQNFSILNKIALNLLKNEKSSKVGVKSRRLKAGWDNHYLIKVLNLMKV